MTEVWKMSDIPILNDGWYDLPSGGAVQIKNGIPIKVSDKGRWDLEEGQILAEVVEFTESKITWRDLDRSKRWRKAGLFSILTKSDRWRWNLANVIRMACENCGCDVGTCWVQPPDQENTMWICDACARDKNL